MDTERSLLQQIRDKEQEVGQQVETARAKAETLVATAKSEAEDLLCTADTAGKTSAGQVYWKERAKTEAEIEALNDAAKRENETASMRAEKNLPAAAEQIVRYVTGE